MSNRTVLFGVSLLLGSLVTNAAYADTLNLQTHFEIKELKFIDMDGDGIAETFSGVKYKGTFQEYGVTPGNGTRVDAIGKFTAEATFTGNVSEMGEYEATLHENFVYLQGKEGAWTYDATVYLNPVSETGNGPWAFRSDGCVSSSVLPASVPPVGAKVHCDVKIFSPDSYQFLQVQVGDWGDCYCTLTWEAGVSACSDEL
jgi:hypothetical protein